MRAGRELVEVIDERRLIAIPVRVPQLDSLAIGKRPQVFRKVRGARHAGALDQHRDDGNVPAQRGRDLETDVVFGIVQAPAAARCLDP